MEYLSTRNNKLKESFNSILFKGLSNDGGLFLPRNWPSININNLKNKSYEEVALNIMHPFVKNEISKEDLFEIINKTYCNFTHTETAPLIKIDDKKFILELFYGPTLAFKDYALQFLGNLFSFYMKNKDFRITILGATSGDTGSAAIEAFKGKDKINVFILHPYNKISEVQRKQMTTVTDKNIYNIAVKGTFDDCQNIVKDLFVDKEIQNKTSLTAINSINWARLMAQTVYYFWSYLHLGSDKVNFIVPSGNFGNIFSAHVAQLMGLPVDNLHIVTNQNDILNQIITQGHMKVNKVTETYSPSMDIQISSNFERQIFESVNNNSEEVKKIMTDFKNFQYFKFDNKTFKHFKNIYKSSAISNETILQTISKFNEKYNYLSDPHTATGLSILDGIDNSQYPYVSLACAHPAKFGNIIKQATGKAPPFPKELDKIFDKKEKMTILPNSSDIIKSHIIQNIKK